MKRLFLFVLGAAVFVPQVAAQDAAPAKATLNEAMDRAVLDYAERLRRAGEELGAARERIAREKAPLLQAQRAAEDRLLAAESESTRLETEAAQSANRRRKLVKDAETLHKNTSYLNTLAQDSLQGYGGSLAPGEDQLHGAALQDLQAGFSGAAKGSAALDTADFLLARVQQALGGYTAAGRAMADGSNEVKTGTFAFIGPQAYFQASPDGGTGVAVRLRDDATNPVVFPVANWTGPEAAALFRGEAGSFAADPSAGKALRLRQTTGTLQQHIEKGGRVAYAILVVGLLAVLLMAQKIYDVWRLAVNDDAAVQAFLDRVRADGRGAESALGTLRDTTRELFATGLRHMDGPKAALEEHLQAVLLRQRLHFERRLPLLAVIATAAPLMGLLGTVVGMVKTFSLITVFGTGNAAKLASGISEVLVATELGLAVAIPTLVVHGFISQRIHKKLAMLERHALEFVTAAKSEKPEEVLA